MTAFSNPYITNTQVGFTKAFTGRTLIIKGLSDFLKSAHANTMVIYGHRCIGKTSVLHHLKGRLLNSSVFVPVYFDLNEKASQALDLILMQLVREIEKIPDFSGLTDKQNLSSESLYTVFPNIISAIPGKITLVLIFDEFEESDWQYLEKKFLFYKYMNKIAGINLPNIKFIFALGRHHDDFDSIYQPFLNHGCIEYISLLSKEETKKLIRCSEKDNSLIWPDAQISSVINITGGHPYLTQKICQVIWDRIYQTHHNNIPKVVFKDMGLGFVHAMKGADKSLNWFWNGLGPWEKVLVSALAEGGFQGVEPEELKNRLASYEYFTRNGSLQEITAHLERSGVIQAEKDRGYSIQVNMIYRWVMAKKPFDRIKEELNHKADELVQAACDLSKEKKLNQAAHALRQAADINPEHPRAMYFLAKILLKQGNAEQAVQILEKLYKSSYPSIRALLIQALLSLSDQTSDEEKKILILEKILNIQPGQPRARSIYWKIFELRGDKALENNDLYQAFADYQKAGADQKALRVQDLIDDLEYEVRYKKKRRVKSSAGFIRKLAGLLCVFFMIFMAGIYGIYLVYKDLSQGLPKIYSLKDYNPPVITSVYSDDNRKIAEFYKERRVVISLSEISQTLINAFISAEDSRFFSHEGVDILGITRAFFKNIEAGAVIQGGSTITQQVIKSFLLSSEKSYERKIKEAVLAYRIDKAFTKEEILILYLNQIYLGYGAYGVEAAAENYFGKSAKTLTLPECAMIAGLAKAPSKDSPVSDLKRAKIRQKYVLNRMAQEGYISYEDAKTAFEAALDIKPRRNWYIDGVPFYTEHIRQYIEQEYGEQALYTDGLKIYTSVNIEMQDIAEQELEKGLKELEKRHKYPHKIRPQGALLCMEIGTGHVKAMVGGRDFTISQFNRAAQSRRQPGSAFKPVIYAAALDKGYTPATMLYDTPVAYPDNGRMWYPGNYDNKYYGPLLLRKAFAQSRNIPVIKVLKDIGVDYAIDYAQKLGINSKLDKGLALALGASGISLLELVNAYSVFANQGRLIKPVFITKIIDRSGKEIYKHQPEIIQAIDKTTAYLMTSLLQSVVQNGTGYKVRNLNRPAAGKTGTTNDFRDAWFIGYTPEYITGTWVGFDIERSLGKSETGSKAASPIWLGFMEKILKYSPVKDFNAPDKGIVYASIDTATGLLPIPESSNIIHECFKDGTVPKRYTPRPVVVITEPEAFFKSGL
ncbi:Penicillin-binding protein 1A [Desulfonema limicola]|uniref:peptidoglycan glycosyltransferase n=1 Tax=Desulfonema limicola TaxID=45656 RepID=A0A975GI02_9BACT|nr:PBP1A family penicillin-binding protein [Desulfonema limicola]QTA82002.1 Penicillin-binding protein 1A [Desulfonema limicola]